MVYFNPNTSIITLNVNGTNTPIIRKSCQIEFKKQDQTICSLQETHKGIDKKSKGGEKGHANTTRKKGKS